MTRLSVAGSLMVFGLLGVVWAAEPAFKDEPALQEKVQALKELEGTYVVTRLEKSGMPAPKEVTESVKVTIKGDELIIKVMGEDKKAKIKTDNSKTPRTIDITPTEGPEKGKTFPGIYKVDNDELTIVFREKGERPKEFTSDGEALLLKLKRDR